MEKGEMDVVISGREARRITQGRKEKPGKSNDVNWAMIRVGALGALGGLMFGYDLGLISGALKPMTEDLGLTKTTQELVVGMLKVGAALGTFIGGAMMLQYGRRLTIVFDSLFFVLGTLIMAVAVDVSMAIIGRIIIGLGVGVSSVVVPCYLGEVSSSQFRGFMVSMYEITIALGMVLAVVVDLIISVVVGSNNYGLQWRLMVAIPTVFGALLLILSFLSLPESPRWLVMKGRYDEAMNALKTLRVTNYQKRNLGQNVQKDDVNTTDSNTKLKLNKGVVAMDGSLGDEGDDGVIAEIELELLHIWSNAEQERAAVDESRGKIVQMTSMRSSSSTASSRQNLTKGIEAGIESSQEKSNDAGKEITVREDNYPSNERTDVSIDLENANDKDSTAEYMNSKGINRDVQRKAVESSNFFKTLFLIISDIYIVVRSEESFSLFVIVVIAILNQFVASTAIINYGTTILGLVGVDSDNSAIGLTASVAACKFLAIVVSAFIVDRVGRRTLLLIGSMGMTIGMVLLTVSLVIDSSVLAVASLLIFISTFALSWAGVFWVLFSELFSMGSKSSALSLASFSLFASGAIVNLTFNNIVDGIETFWPLLFAGIALFSFFFVLFTLPETKQKTLVDVQELMRQRGSKFGQWIRVLCCCFKIKQSK